MDIKLEKEKIRRRYFSTGGLIVVSVLGILGALFIYFSGIFDVVSLNMLYKCLSKRGIMLIFGGFFLFVSIYCWILFYLNIIVDPKKEVLYLHKNGDSDQYFLDKKGKKYDYVSSKVIIQTDCHYSVLKTHDYVCDIIGRVNESWVPKEKKSYWLNWYSPIGYFENIFLLPIIYLFLTPGLLVIILSPGYSKFLGLILAIVPLYLIVYDIIYKYKFNSGKINDLKTLEDKHNFDKAADLIVKGLYILPIIAICIFFIVIYLKLTDNTSRLIFLPFLACGFSTLGYVYSTIKKNEKLANIFAKSYVAIFLLFWFGIITFFTITIIKQGESLSMLLFTIPFWLAGLYLLYSEFFKKNKNKKYNKNRI